MKRNIFSILGIILIGCFAGMLFINLDAPKWLEYLTCICAGWMAGFILPIFYDKCLAKDKE